MQEQFFKQMKQLINEKNQHEYWFQGKKWNKTIDKDLLGSEARSIFVHILPSAVVEVSMVSNLFTAEGENGCLICWDMENMSKISSICLIIVKGVKKKRDMSKENK